MARCNSVVDEHAMIGIDFGLLSARDGDGVGTGTCNEELTGVGENSKSDDDGNDDCSKDGDDDILDLEDEKGVMVGRKTRKKAAILLLVV